VTVTVQLKTPGEGVQASEEKVTAPAPETFDQVTVPAGDGYPLVTVAVQVIDDDEPIPKDDSVHDILVTEGAFVMVSLAVPELALLSGLPPYVPSIVTLPGVTPVTVTEHVPDERVHVVEGRKTEPAPPTWDQLTVPVGE
jgi:hypothetical protein